MDYEERHNDVLEPGSPSIIECLGPEQEKIVAIDKTRSGYRFVECCDGYYGTTLSQAQFEQLIAELQALAIAPPGKHVEAPAS
ncbi:Uncharacterised protein [Halioglobus japonicus]|nr:Uncharacterised protein [Halioglobus japonicus]